MEIKVTGVPSEIKKWLQEESKKQSMTMSQLVRLILRDHINENKKP